MVGEGKGDYNFLIYDTLIFVYVQTYVSSNFVNNLISNDYKKII